MKGLRVRDIMIQEVTTLKRNDKLTLADDIMQLGRIRHLPVLADDTEQLVGIVSQRDLFRGALASAWIPISVIVSLSRHHRSALATVDRQDNC